MYVTYIYLSIYIPIYLSNYYMKAQISQGLGPTFQVELSKTGRTPNLPTNIVPTHIA